MVTKMNSSEAVDNILESIKDEDSYLDLWSAYKRIQKLELGPSEDKKKAIRLALIGSSTLEPVAACLDIKTRLMGLKPKTFVGGFNTYRQEALDDSSSLYSHEPDLIVLAVDAASLLDDLFTANFVRMEEEERQEHLEKMVHDLVGVAEALKNNGSGLVIVNNFIVPEFTPLGIVDNKEKTGLRRFFREANRMLESTFRDESRMFVFDLDSATADYGKSRVVDWKTYYRGSVPFAAEFIPTLASEYARYASAFKGLTKKCIVLDLDNTLWGGVVGEEGMEGIKLGPTSPGIEYLEFQKSLMSLYNRGVILAVNSKNNWDDAMKPIREHPHQILREEHFAAFRINWQNKAQNFLELAEEINIGLDSMVFIDDNPHERAQVRQAVPDVMVVEMPDNPQLYRKTLENLKVFDVLSLTQEDMKRGEMYVGKRKRAELEEKTGSIEDFLRTLNLKVHVQQVDKFGKPRVVQLIGKTNQFNLTTRRYTDSEVESFRESDDSAVFSMAVKDKFGDEGIVGVAITKIEANDCIIDSFLMSCRVIGRSVETAFLSKIVSYARERDANRVIGEVIPTKKNAPARDFYERHGFEEVGTSPEGVTRWVLDLEKEDIPVPDWIQMVEE
ncbi:HAD-IIIC family phosphatase [Candidatus Thorarchaeota archaeon]|nr:MAG: HAD-IIIC family phosphatase [Candidatus Thorarchaeota archaeon]